MAKKAKKVSWRTLARRAGSAASPTVAKRMRAKSAALRRADRAAKAKKKAAPAARRNLSGAKRAVRGWATRKANEIKKAATAGGVAALVASAPAQQNGINREPTQAWHRVDTPGQGEIVGGALSQLAERLTKLARKKGGKDDIQRELAALSATSKYEGCVETDRTATKRLVEVQQLLADRVICGFIAEVDACQAQHRGLPPTMTFNVSSFLIVKIVDALNKAGYRASGKT